MCDSSALILCSNSNESESLLSDWQCAGSFCHTVFIYFILFFLFFCLGLPLFINHTDEPSALFLSQSILVERERKKKQTCARCVFSCSSFFSKIFPRSCFLYLHHWFSESLCHNYNKFSACGLVKRHGFMGAIWYSCLPFFSFLAPRLSCSQAHYSCWFLSKRMIHMFLDTASSIFVWWVVQSSELNSFTMYHQKPLFSGTFVYRINCCNSEKTNWRCRFLSLDKVLYTYCGCCHGFRFCKHHVHSSHLAIFPHSSTSQ